MKRQVVSLIALSILTFTIAGCAAKQVSLVKENQVTVEKKGSEKVKILCADVYQENGQVWAYGILEQDGTGIAPVKTHVDIQVVTLDGSVSYETISKDIYLPGHRVGKGIHWKRFKSQLPETLSAGSQVTMTVHSGDHKPKENKS